jgi:primosomal protein N' (replication factor Y) (superfamily II helicase)
MSDYAHVAVPIPGEEYYTYNVPERLKDGAALGKRVLVPFRNRRLIGFIVGFGDTPPEFKLRDILDVLDEEPLFNQRRLEFLRWIADYYITSLGIVLKAAHPGGLGVSVRRQIRITEEGSSALTEDRFTEHERLVLNTIENSGEITSQKLLGLIQNTSNELLNSLRRRGLITFDYELRSDPKVKTRKIITAKAGASLMSPILARKHAKTDILEFVLTHGRVPLEDLRDIFGNVGSHIPWLQEKEFIDIELEEVARDPFAGIPIERDSPHELSPDQSSSLKKITEAISRGRYSPFLLHGVTGSGKTEVYLRAIAEVIEAGKKAVVLVPEISLTPQLVKRFRARFGKKVAVIHSALSDGERFDAWRLASRGEVDVVIGARSAIFAPFNNIGIIVVDEEHESTYKQEEAPSYNARDIALVLGKMTGSVVLLGSATPSLESYHNAIKHKFGYLALPLRVLDKPLPEVSVTDMKFEDASVFSAELKTAIQKNFEDKRQTILFLNRRGFSTLIICPSCGDTLKCPNCSVTLTYHVREDSVKCHLCGLSEKMNPECGECGADLRGLGIGTQKVEEELRALLPGAALARMDRDSVAGKSKLLSLYGKLERGEVDVLIGTQMVAKGHDLPGVTLVGVISADISLGIPDFRSGERTFQLVTQVAGRAGRGRYPGRVIVQTFNPGHPSITHAVKQDSVGYLKEEIKLREELGYPPFSRLVNVRFSGIKELETKSVANQSGDIARKLASTLPAGAIEILGPSPCPISKMSNRYRFQMLIKSQSTGVIHGFSKKLISLVSKDSGPVRVSLDVDPYNFS